MAQTTFENLLDQANSAAGQGDWQAAVELLGRAQGLRPKDAGVASGLGTCLLQLGEVERAVEQFQKVVRLAPENLEARNNLGIAATLAGDLVGAEAAFRSVIAVEPEHTHAWKNLAQVCLRQPARLAEGVQILASVVQAQPGDVEAMQMLAEIYEEGDDFSSAETLYHRITQLEPAHAQAQAALERLRAARPAPAQIARPEHAKKLAALKNLRRDPQPTPGPATPAAPSPAAQPCVWERGEVRSAAFYAAPDLTAFGQFQIWAARLEKAGGRAKVAAEVELGDMEGYELLVFSNPHLSPALITGVNACMQAGKPYAVDLDQDFHHLPAGHPAYDLFGPGNPRAMQALEIMLKDARWVSVPTQALAEQYSGYAQKIELVPPAVDRDDPRWSRPKPRRDAFHIGWVGSPADRPDLLTIQAELTEFLASRPNVRLLLAGDPGTPAAFASLPEDQVQYLPLTSAEDMPYLLGQFDLLIWPLRDIPYNQSRSPLLLLQAEARGVKWLAGDLPYSMDVNPKGLSQSDWSDELVKSLINREP